MGFLICSRIADDVSFDFEVLEQIVDCLQGEEV